VLLRRVADSGEREPDVRWRYFSLAQVNNKVEGWTVWGAAADDPEARGRLAFLAAEAARRQGRFEEVHWGLLRARHEEKQELDDRAVVDRVAAEAGVDAERWAADMADPDLAQALARDHEEAVGRLGVFGTPTLVLEGRGAAYVRVMPAPEGAAAVALYDQLVEIVGEEPYLSEIKRPKPPET
jgi:predicted DsbA family dithiol-disulfide isomerase